MIKIQGKIPRSVVIAVSGGVDSMAVLDFLRRNHSVTAAVFDHADGQHALAMAKIEKYCHENNIPILEGGINPNKEKPKELSLEEWWRQERYKWLDSLGETVVCHHLDDVAETWIWSSLNGTPKIIPYSRNNVIRPFRLNRKEEFIGWCQRHNVPWHEDTTNQNINFTRNRIRHVIMPELLKVNPGLHTMLAKKVIQDFDAEKH